MIAGITLASSSAFAGYGAAGCGLGSFVFGDNNSWWAQTLGATTNGTSGSQTFGITTGTSNCDASALFGHIPGRIDLSCLMNIHN